LSPGSFSINENSTAPFMLPGNIVVTDDALGANLLGLGGPDAAFFSIVGNKLQYNAGANLDAEVKSRYDILITVDDPSLGTTFEASTTFTLFVSDIDEFNVGPITDTDPAANVILEGS